MSLVLQFNILFGLLIVLYGLLLKPLTFYQVNRFFLLGSSVLALVLPIIPLTSSISSETSILLMPAQVLATEADVSLWHFPHQKLIDIIYWLGVSISIGFQGLGLLKLYRVYQSSHTKASDTSYLVNDSGHAFSFFGLISLPNDVDTHTEQMMWNHENIHRSQWHSLDVALFSIIKVVCWFNPLVYIAAYWQKLNHEFIVDERLNKAYGTDYQHTLLNEIFGTEVLPITNSFFNKSTIKQRIMNMNKRKSRVSSMVRYVIVFPAIAAGLWLNACSNNTPSVVDKETDLSLTATSQSKIHKPDEVDVWPEFPGGNQALSAYLGEQVKFPKELEESGAEATVYVNFVVAENGAITNVKMKRKSDYPAFDDAAMQAVNSMPNWDPALKDDIPVKAEMILPFKFKLG